MTALVFIYTSETWPPFAFGRPIFLPQRFTREARAPGSGPHQVHAKRMRACGGMSRHNHAAPSHSITSPARASSVRGTSSPSALAVIRLMTRSNLVGCSTGM